MKITIVTVSFNEEKNIARTIESVLSQDSFDYEYIICDGKSSDKTVDIAESYTDKFRAKGINYIVNSEKDLGIYDGMNKGIDLADGEYIYFLNAGDWLYSSYVISRIVSCAKEQSIPDVIYGDIATVERGFVGFSTGDDSKLLSHMSICHQAVFVLTQHMKARKYDLNYKVMADYNLLLSLKMENKSFFHINETIAYFLVGGVSNTNGKQYYSDLINIRTSHGLPITFKNKIKYKIGPYRTSVVNKAKILMPKKIWYWWNIKIKKKILINDN